MSSVAVAGVRESLRSWVNEILNVVDLMAIPIIFSHQDAPEPDEQYVLIEQAPTRNRVGWPAKGSPDEVTGEARWADDYADTFTVQDVNGLGDVLRRIMTSFDLPGSIEFFRSRGMAFIGAAGDIIPIREKIANRWYIRHAVDLQFHVGAAHDVDVGVIENVQYSGSVDGNTGGSPIPVGPTTISSP